MAMHPARYRAALTDALMRLIEADTDYTDGVLNTGALATAAGDALSYMLYEAREGSTGRPPREYAADCLEDLAYLLDLDGDAGVSAVLDRAGVSQSTALVGGVADALSVVRMIAGINGTASDGDRHRDEEWLRARAREVARSRSALYVQSAALLGDLLRRQRNHTATLAGVALGGEPSARALFAEALESDHVDDGTRRLARLVLRLCAALDTAALSLVLATRDHDRAHLSHVPTRRVTDSPPKRRPLDTLTGSLDRNAPPAAARLGVCATRGQRNAKHADTRRREPSAA